MAVLEGVERWALILFVNTSRIIGQGYSQASTFWGLLNVSLRACGSQLRDFERSTLSKIGEEDKTLQTDKQPHTTL